MKVKLEDYYFSEALRWTFLILGLAVTVYLMFWTPFWWGAIFLILFILLAFSTKYETTIDTDNGTITDTFQLFWIKTKSEEISFNTLHKITIDKERHTYTANSRVKTGVTDYFEYIAILEYDGNHFEFKRSVDYQSFATEVKEVAEKLKLEVERNF